MQLVKPLILLLVIVGLGVGGYYYKNNKELPNPSVLGITTSMPQLPSAPSLELGNPNLEEATSTVKDQLNTLKERSLTVKEHAEQAFAKSKAEESDQAVHERALEYGQYIYCKGIVDEWEEK